MGSRRRKRKPSDKPAVQPVKKRKLFPAMAAIIGVGIVAVVVFVNLPHHESYAAKDPAPSTPVAPATADAAAKEPAAASEAKPGFEVLRGKWRRPDGGYLVEVKSVDASGKMDATYANPRRINVSKAEASQDNGAIKVFIELRDANYPGSTYNLTYDPGTDQLQGIYFQAALQQQFEVFFVRVK